MNPQGYLQDDRPERSLAWSPFAVVQVPTVSLMWTLQWCQSGQEIKSK
jgi:hypothetical protein